MSEVAQDKNRVRFGFFALGFALFTVGWFIAAALGTKYGIWSWQFGLGTMYFAWGPIIAILSILLSVAALIVGLIWSPRTRTVMLALGALFVSGLIAGRLFGMAATAAGLPPIHQASTDWADQVPFSENLLEKRFVDQCDTSGDQAVDPAEEARCGINAVEDNPTLSLSTEDQARWPGFHGRLVADIQTSNEMDPALRGEDRDQKPYPPLNTLVTDMDQTQVFDIALEMVRERGWNIAGANHGKGRIEGWAFTPWFGFRDDFALRVLANEAGQTEVDMRSISRVGISDLGANSQRVYGFLAELEREIEAAS
ncbi:MAG: DUF1499 domain-containing protein [Pseudomonadota bacterium]